MTRASKAPAEKKQRQPVGFFVIILAVILIVIVGGVFYFSNGENNQPANNNSQPNNGLNFAPGGLASPTEEELERGDVGEVTEEGYFLPAESITPFSIFSTTGKIVELNGEELVVDGSGTNFADGTARRLTCAFLETTLTLTRNPVKYYKGKDGIDKLREGAEVLLMSGENIRGKTEFNLKVVKILE